MATHLPQPISLVICDDVIHDPQTGKIHLIGCASGFGLKIFPHKLDALTVFIALAGTPGTHSGQIFCSAPDGRKNFGSTPHSLRFTAAAPVTWAVFRIERVPFPVAGIYRLQFVCDNELLSERQLLVRFKGGNGDV